MEWNAVPEKWGEKRKARLRIIAVALILILHFGLLIFTGREKSATSDEPFHIARGVSALFSGDFRMSVAHPPLVNLISTLPLLFFRDLQVPFALPAWQNPRAPEPFRKSQFSRYFLWVHDRPEWKGNADPLRIIFWTRFPIMVLSALLGLLLYLWSSRLWGIGGGFLSLLLYAFSPTVLAHASLNTTDLGSALFIFLFAFTLDRHLHEPSWKKLLLCGFTFGLAQLSKFTAILLFPLLPLALFLGLPGPWKMRLRRFFSLSPLQPESQVGFFGGLLIFLLGAIVIWAGYGFELHSIHRFADLELGPHSLTFGFTLKRLVVSVLAALPFPPPTYYFGLARTLFDTEAHFHPLYFFGKVSEAGGWWYYYPVLFVIKEPLALLALLGIAFFTVKQPTASPRPTLAMNGVFSLGLVLFFMFLNQKNIGLRHLLPVYPFLFLWLGRLAKVRWRKVFPLAIWILAGAYAINGLIAFPDYLVHFNSLVGGPEGGLRYSVVGEDWGQDISALGKFCQEKNIKKIFYKPYGNADPAAYGVPAESYHCDELNQSGWYAVHIVDLRRPRQNKDEENCFSQFLNWKPVAILHHTIYVYFRTENPPVGPSPSPSSP